MRIFLSLFFVINIFCLANSFAQENGRIAAMEVKASAVVTDNLFMLTIRNIDLINPKVEGDFIKVSPIHSDFAGMFKILGTPGARVRITYLQNELIKEENSGPGEVYAEYVLSAAFDDIQFQSALLDVGEGVFPIGPDGELYVWLGANLDLSAAMPSL